MSTTPTHMLSGAVVAGTTLLKEGWSAKGAADMGCFYSAALVSAEQIPLSDARSASLYMSAVFASAAWVSNAIQWACPHFSWQRGIVLLISGDVIDRVAVSVKIPLANDIFRAVSLALSLTGSLLILGSAFENRG